MIQINQNICFTQQDNLPTNQKKIIIVYECLRNHKMHNTKRTIYGMIKVISNLFSFSYIYAVFFHDLLLHPSFFHDNSLILLDNLIFLKLLMSQYFKDVVSFISQLYLSCNPYDFIQNYHHNGRPLLQFVQLLFVGLEFFKFLRCLQSFNEGIYSFGFVAKDSQELFGLSLILEYYDFFKKINDDPQKYIPEMPTNEQFKNHKIKYLKGNKFYQELHSYDKPYTRVKNTQRQGTIVNYIVIIGMFQLEITLLNFNQNANIQENKIGSGSFGSVRIQSQNNRMFAVKRQMFQEKYHLKQFNMMANKNQINQAITQLAIYKICSLLKIGPAAETDIGFDLICYNDCIEFQIQYCIKIEYNSQNDQKQGIYVDKSKFEKQIKQGLLKLHFFQIIHKDIKPANILFSIKYNKYVFTDFGLSHPIVEKIGQLSITHLQGTYLYMSKQMRQIEKGKTGYLHLYGNDVHSLQCSLNKWVRNQNIEKGMKKFNQKIIKQYNTKYEYEYLKLKYYCIKPDINMKEVQNYWRHMDTNRMEELLSIIDKSIKFDKIKSVYNYLSKLQQFKKQNLESLRIQSQSIKSMKIVPDIKQINQLKLKNTLRVYGYNQSVKDMIIQLKLQKKFPHTLKMIDEINANNDVDHRDRMFGNHANYIKKIKKQIDKCQQKKDYESIFKGSMIILEYGNKQEIIKTVQKLKMLNYERKKDEKVEEMIRVINIEKKKEKIKQFVQQMENEKEEIDKIVTERKLEYNVAEIYNYVGDYEKALQYHTKDLNMNIVFYRQQHPSVANIYNNIANVYQKMGKYEKALQYNIKSINMKILFYGQQHPSVARTNNNIGNVYKDMGIFEKALQYYTKSVNIKISFYGQQHRSVANIYNNIANVYINMGKYEKALQYYTKSVNMKILFCGQQHRSVAETYHNIGNVYKYMGKYEKALQYYNKSVNMMIQFYGQQHPSLGTIYINIANVQQDKGNYYKALQYYNKSVNMLIQFYGQQHPSVADTYNNIGIAYQHIGNYYKALQYYTKSVNMKISFYGQQHPSVADTYNNIGLVYQHIGNYEIPLYYFTKSIIIMIQFYGQQHPTVSLTYHNVSMTYLAFSQLTQSLKYCNKSIKIQQNLSQMLYPQVPPNYHVLSSIFLKKQKYAKSLHYEYSALDTFLKISHIDNHKSPFYLSQLADIYYQMNRFIQSYFFYRISCQISVKYFPIHHKYVRNAKRMMNEMERSMPSLIHNYNTNIQFMNQISIKYSQLPKHKLMKLLIAKKSQLKFEQKHRNRRDKFQFLKCLIEIYLCYKYLEYLIQLNKVGAQIKQELMQFDQSQQKSIFRELIYEIF